MRLRAPHSSPARRVGAPHARDLPRPLGHPDLARAGVAPHVEPHLRREHEGALEAHVEHPGLHLEAMRELVDRMLSVD